ncbi:MAG: protein-export chaperone SecB [Gammaproteobacteria bacterium]
MADKPAQKFEIQKIYIKDLSFETPNSPKIFTEKWHPKTDVHIQTENNKLDENIFEVAITVTVTATQGESTAFLAEVNQAGIFLIEHFSKDQHKQLLGSYCPNILFPFARETVAELVAKGGFPQLLLNPVNFDALYQQHLSAVKEQKDIPEDKKH